MIALVVVLLGLVAGGELVGAVDRDRERADVVARRRDVVGQRAVRPRVAPGRLLAQHREADAVLRARRRRPRRAPARSRRRRAPAASRRGRSRRAARSRRRRARARPAGRGSPGTCPSAPRRGRRTASRCTAAARRATARPTRVPVNDGHRQLVVLERLAVRARGGERQQRPALLLGVLHAQPLLLLAVLGVERAAAHRVEQVGDDADDARGVEHVDGLTAVGGRDPDGGVLARGRRAADQERQLEPAPLHLLRHLHHLVERRRDQAGEPDRVRALA